MPITMPLTLTRAPLPGMWMAGAAFDDERVGLVPLDVQALEEPVVVGRGVC